MELNEEQEKPIDVNADADLGENTEEQSVEVETEEQEEALSIFDEVKAITNIEVEGEFEDSIQGYAEREIKVYEKGLIDAEERLRQEDPDIYELYLYKKNGGNPLELLAKKLSSTKTEVNSPDDAKQVIRHYLLSVGEDEEDIQARLDTWEDTGKLEEKAKKYIELTDKQRDVEYKKELERQEQWKKQLEEDKLVVQNNIVSKIDKGDIGQFIASKDDREAFKQYLFDGKIQQTWDGKYILTKELNPNDLDHDLMAEFLKFKKGDLKSIVQKQAKTESVKRIQRNIKNNTTDNKQQEEDPLLRAWGFIKK